ncbi:hypothetical protein ACB098_02G070400 [Castanea mollissima]
MNKTQTPDLFLKEPQNLIPRLPNPFKSTPLSKISQICKDSVLAFLSGFYSNGQMLSLYYPKAPKKGSFSFSQATLACFGTTQNKTTQNKCDSKSKRGKRLVFLCSLREFESTGVERGTWNSEKREREREKEKWWWGLIKREAMELSVFGDD